MNNTPDSPAHTPDDRTDQGGNYWTLFTPGIWKLLHAVSQAIFLTLTKGTFTIGYRAERTWYRTDMKMLTILHVSDLHLGRTAKVDDEEARRRRQVAGATYIPFYHNYLGHDRRAVIALEHFWGSVERDGSGKAFRHER